MKKFKVVFWCFGIKFETRYGRDYHRSFKEGESKVHKNNIFTVEFLVLNLDVCEGELCVNRRAKLQKEIA